MRRLRRRIVLCGLGAAFIGLTTASSAWAFTDVPPRRIDYTAITGLALKRAVEGFPDGTFRPDSTALRAEFVKMVAAAVFLPLRGSDRTPFRDVGSSAPELSYPDSYVAAAHAAGLVKGKSPAVFDPSGPLTRAQAMTIAVRAAQKLHARDLKPLSIGYHGRFASFDDTTHGQNAKLAEANGLLAGIDLSGWDPWTPATRSEAALIVWNLVNCFG